MSPVREERFSWKSVSAVLIGILCTGLTSWFAFGASRISRDDMVEYTSTRYVPHTEFDQKFQSVSVETAVITTKLDQIIRELREMKESVKK